MSLSHSPKIVTSGLVFAYDMGNDKKSWKGAPATNLIPYSQDYGSNGNFMSNWTGNLFSNWINSVVTTGYRAPDGNYTANLITGKYSRWTASITAATSTTYTFSIWLKDYGLTNPINLHVAFGLNGSLVNYNNITSVPIASIRNWTRYSVTVTSPASGINQIQCGVEFGASKSTSAGPYAVAVWGAQVEAGSYATPYVPSLGTSGSRSNTQALVDLTGNHTLTSSSGVIYNSDGTFSFTTTANTSYFDLNSQNIISGTNPFTIEAWTNKTSGSYGEIFGNFGSAHSTGLWFATAGLYIVGSVYHTDYANSMAGIHHSAATRDSSGNVKLYRDGVLVSTGTLTSSIPSNINFRIGADVNGGGESLGGNIYNVKVYNQVLTAAEVTQNFNALRGRYGI